MNKFKSIIKVAATVADLIIATSFVIEGVKYGYNKLMKNKLAKKSTSEEVEAEVIEEPATTEN